jgi:hypothetical protein
MAEVDEDGQPLNLLFNAKRRIDRDINEMLGLIKGVIADGCVNELEVLAVRKWMDTHPDVSACWPGDAIWERLARIFSDGRVSEEEQQDFAALLQATVGESATTEMNRATRLPLDDPAPQLIFRGMTYLFTGRFVYGTRITCEYAVMRLGALCADRVSHKINYVVIGEIGSRDWAHTAMGRKIEDVVHLRERGVPIHVVAEQHWVNSIRSSSQPVTIG